MAEFEVFGESTIQVVDTDAQRTVVVLKYPWVCARSAFEARKTLELITKIAIKRAKRNDG